MKVPRNSMHGFSILGAMHSDLGMFCQRLHSLRQERHEGIFFQNISEADYQQGLSLLETKAADLIAELYLFTALCANSTLLNEEQR